MKQNFIKNKLFIALVALLFSSSAYGAVVTHNFTSNNTLTLAVGDSDTYADIDFLNGTMSLEQSTDNSANAGIISILYASEAGTNMKIIGGDAKTITVGMTSDDSKYYAATVGENQTIGSSTNWGGRRSHL